MSISRREAIACLCVSLALVFAPFQRFAAGFAKMLERLLREPERRVFSYDPKSIRITFGGVTIYPYEDGRWMSRKGYLLEP